MDPQIFTPHPQDDPPTGSEPPSGQPMPLVPAAPSAPVITPTPPSLQPTPTPDPLPATPAASFQATSFTPPTEKKRGKKRFIIAGVIVIALLGLAAGAVFGLYLPSQPDNVWKAGVSRSGKALDKVVASSTDIQKLEAFKKSDINISLDAKRGEDRYKGSFTAKFDATKADVGLNIFSEGDEQGPSLELKLLSELSEGGQFPNIFFKVSGLASSGLDTFFPQAAAYENKWIFVSEDYLKSLTDFPTAEDANKKKLTSEDIAELSQAVSDVTVDRVFTTDSDKAVFFKKDFVGKEMIDDMQTYHYTVGLHKENAIAYCEALIDKIVSTNAYKKLPWVDEADVEEDREVSKKECRESMFNEIEEDESFDLWIDLKHKLIHKMRFTDRTTEDVYTEIGQTYKGGDDVSLFVVHHDGKNNSDFKFTLDTNIQTNVSSGTFKWTGGEADGKYEVDLVLTAKPYEGDIHIEKPTDVIPIQEILNQVGIDPSVI